MISRGYEGGECPRYYDDEGGVFEERRVYWGAV